MNEIYFENVSNVGTLYLEKVLDRFEDENIIFVCKDELDHRYFCVCYEFRLSLKWILTEIDADVLVRVISGQCDMQSIFGEKVIHIVYKDGKETSEMVSRSDMPERVFPTRGICLDKNRVDNIMNYLCCLEIDSISRRIKNYFINYSAENQTYMKYSEYYKCCLNELYGKYLNFSSAEKYTVEYNLTTKNTQSENTDSVLSKMKEAA